MPQNPNRLPTSSPESLGPEAATSSSYSLDSDDRFKGKLNASDLDAEALFDPARRKQLEEAQLTQDDWEAYLNQRPDEYGKDPNGNLLPSEEDLYNQTLNEARREREATSLTDLATAAGEALARGNKTMADDLQDEILQRLIERAETYDLSQEAIDQRIRQLTKIMDNAENVAKEKATKAATQRTLSFPATPQAPESAPATQSEPTQTVPTAPVKPVQPRSPLQTSSKPAQAEPGEAPDLMRLDELQVIIDLMRERDAHKKEPKGSSWSDAEKAWHEEMYNTYDALITVKDKIIDPATSDEEIRKLEEQEKVFSDALESLKNSQPAPELPEGGEPSLGEDGAGPDLEAHAAKQDLYERKLNDYTNESQKILDEREKVIRSLPDDLKEQADEDFDGLAIWLEEMRTTCTQLVWIEEVLASSATSAEERQALLEEEEKLIAKIGEMENNKPEIKTMGRPVSGEDGNDGEVLDATRLRAAEQYEKEMNACDWLGNAYHHLASEDESLVPEDRSRLQAAGRHYWVERDIYLKLRDVELALAKPSISDDEKQALIDKASAFSDLLVGLRNHMPEHNPFLDLATHKNNGETNSQSAQNKDGAEEQPESKNNKADKENGEKWRRFKKFGEWFIRVSGINEPTSSIDTASKSSDGTGNTVDQEQRVKVKVPRKQPPNPIPKRQVRRKSSTNATN
jgi:hypothetical protein